MGYIFFTLGVVAIGAWGRMRSDQVEEEVKLSRQLRSERIIQAEKRREECAVKYAAARHYWQDFVSSAGTPLPFVLTHEGQCPIEVIIYKALCEGLVLEDLKGRRFQVSYEGLELRPI